MQRQDIGASAFAGQPQFMPNVIIVIVGFGAGPVFLKISNAEILQKSAFHNHLTDLTACLAARPIRYGSEVRIEL